MSTDNMRMRLVDITYEMITQSGMKNVKVREIAKKAGCTAALIYHYFENLDYLIALASLHCMEQYIVKTIQITNSKDDNITKNLKIWKLFIEYAFQFPEIFLNLFWGEGKRILDSALTEYFNLYSTRFERDIPAYLLAALYNSSMEERDFMWLRRVVDEGRLTLENAVYISKVDSFIVQGMLSDFIINNRPEDQRKIKAAECYELVEKTICSFLK